MAKSKVCPFCGDNAEPGVEEFGYSYFCVCVMCGAQAGFANSVSEAKKAWQQRKGEKKLLQGIIDEIEGTAPECEAHGKQLKQQATLLKAWLRRLV